MTDMLCWHPLYNTGIHQIDLQHKTLLALCNSLAAAIDKHQSTIVLQDIISDFLGYLTYHNNYEEQLMQIFDYPNRQSHVAEHQALTARLRRLLRSDGLITEHQRLSQDTLLEILAEHISGDDIELGHYLAEHIPAQCDTSDLILSKRTL